MAAPTLQIDDDITAALGDGAVARAAFAALAPLRQREYVTSIAGSRRADTRGRRIARMIDMLTGKPS